MSPALPEVITVIGHAVCFVLPSSATEVRVRVTSKSATVEADLNTREGSAVRAAVTSGGSDTRRPKVRSTVLKGFPPDPTPTRPAAKEKSGSGLGTRLTVGKYQHNLGLNRSLKMCPLRVPSSGRLTPALTPAGGIIVVIAKLALMFGGSINSGSWFSGTVASR
jgi:hypothetical protein